MVYIKKISASRFEVVSESATLAQRYPSIGSRSRIHCERGAACIQMIVYISSLGDITTDITDCQVVFRESFLTSRRSAHSTYPGNVGGGGGV